MKVESVTIQNFKRFENLPTISFKNKTLQEVSDQYLILGDNGTGKTTILQAIALPLALATRQIDRVANFNWMGFLYSRYWKWGTPHIELEVSFEEAEIQATKEVSKRWYDYLPDDFKQEYIEPSDSKLIKVILDGEEWKAGSNQQERLQFQGRYYVQKTLPKDPSIRSKFSELPGVFWFDQYRLKSSESSDTSDSQLDSHNISIETIEKLRPYLLNWNEKRQKTQNYRINNDYYLKLENSYKRIFKGRSFSGKELSNSTDEEFFILNDGNRNYDIVEMSGGEYAVFPILYEFIRQQIAYSVVLIDEIDLNLHPPLAQHLVNQLPQLSPTCQFIFTTHSEAVTDIVSNDEIYRLQGGSLCL